MSITVARDKYIIPHISKLWYIYLMEKSTKPPKAPKNPKTKKTTKTSLKTRTQRVKARFLSSYYGNPTRDMKVICITGSTGKSTVAHFVHQILTASGKQTAIFASEKPIKTAMLHKFFSDAWKAGSSYVVVTSPATSLKNNVFYGLPIHVAALTDFVPASLSDLNPEEYLKEKSTLFNMKPAIVVLNQDDAYYQEFSKFSGTESTLTYGSDFSCNIRIDNTKLYKKGIEANLAYGSSRFTVASFLTGEPIASYMACASAIAIALGISTDTIADGIANYNPETK